MYVKFLGMAARFEIRIRREAVMATFSRTENPSLGHTHG
jgi:hypothetical protein